MMDRDLSLFYAGKRTAILFSKGQCWCEINTLGHNGVATAVAMKRHLCERSANTDHSYPTKIIKKCEILHCWTKCDRQGNNVSENGMLCCVDVCVCVCGRWLGAGVEEEGVDTRNNLYFPNYPPRAPEVAPLLVQCTAKEQFKNNENHHVTEMLDNHQNSPPGQ